MSYSRFGCGDPPSDVYIFLHCGLADGPEFLTCCGCILGEDGDIPKFDTAQMLAHIDEHRAAGHHVPWEVDAELLDDDAENFPRAEDAVV